MVKHKGLSLFKWGKKPELKMILLNILLLLFIFFCIGIIGAIIYGIIIFIMYIINLTKKKDTNEEQ